MNKLLKFALVSVISAAVPATFAAGDADQGKAKAAICAGCHGADGNSAAPSFPKLAEQGEKYLLKQMQDIKSGERKVVEMTGMLNSFSEQDMANVAAYFAGQAMQLSGAKEIEVLVNSGIKVDGLKLGEKLYRNGNMETSVPACSGCHSPAGKGNFPAGFPRLGGQHADYIAKQLKAFRAGERTNDGDTQIMRQVAKNLSDAEITALANYISGLH